MNFFLVYGVGVATQEQLLNANKQDEAAYKWIQEAKKGEKWEDGSTVECLGEPTFFNMAEGDIYSLPHILSYNQPPEMRRWLIDAKKGDTHDSPGGLVRCFGEAEDLTDEQIANALTVCKDAYSELGVEPQVIEQL